MERADQDACLRMTDDQREAYEERAGILQFEAGMTREEAERVAMDLTVPAQKAAIHRCYVFSVYRMRDYGLMLEQAHIALQRAFMRKGILG
jgi:hypothetical protein